MSTNRKWDQKKIGKLYKNVKKILFNNFVKHVFKEHIITWRNTLNMSSFKYPDIFLYDQNFIK